MKYDQDCPFCNLDREPLLRGDGCFAIYDRFPVSEGHCLVIPEVHTADYFELAAETKESLWQLVDRTRNFLKDTYNTDSFNIGINCGAPAGQTVFHVHIHVIPRYSGDTANPRGGVRGVIPKKRNY